MNIQQKGSRITSLYPLFLCSLYYSPKGESSQNLEFMRLIDAYFLAQPHSGVIAICALLKAIASTSNGCAG
jgi:hypothetical protein